MSAMRKVIMSATYSQGHAGCVLQSHSQRNISNSAAYLVPHLDALAAQKPHFRLLDVGCGPGSITIDFARRYPEATIVGVEPSEADTAVLDAARASAREADVRNVTFDIAEVHSLGSWTGEKGLFDVVHAHQLLQHCGNIVNALKQMRSSTEKGGFVAARTADLNTAPCYPAGTPGIVRSNEIRCKLFFANGGDPYAGAHQHVDAVEAGFAEEKVHATLGLQTSGTTQADVVAFANNTADRLLEQGFVDGVCRRNISTREELDSLAAQIRSWGEIRGAWSVFVNGEMVCYV